MKSRIVILTAALLALGACNNSSPKEDPEATHEHSGEHVFACPMHPEIKGKEGDKCPKCGMDLEHTHEAENGSTYKMKFSSNPAEIEAGKQVVLSLIPQIVGKETESVALDIEHEKKIHFIMVSNDLSWFDHQHPEYNASGSYNLPYTFKNGGKYLLFADYKPTGAGHNVEKINVDVKGNAVPVKTFTESRLISNVDGFEVKLSSETSIFESGEAQHIKGVITQGGKALDATVLENYLGAKAHMVVISVEDKNYLHVHPGVENGVLDLHTTFDKPGIYRGWLQFKTGGKVHTADFVIKVVKGKGNAKAGADDMKGIKH